MFPDQFDYVAADSVEHTLELLTEHSTQDVELLAGGHSLIPTMKSGLASPDVLIDIGDVPEIQGITETDDGLVVGATTTYDALLDDGRIHEVAPAFGEAVAAVGDIQVRNRGTVGGNLAHADPASDLPGAALACDATIHIHGPDGERSVGADDMFLGMYMTAVEHDELLTRVEFPRRDGAVYGRYKKKPSPSSGYAMVGVAVSLTVDDGIIVDAGVGANGVMDHGVRLTQVETALIDTPLDEVDPEAIGAHATDELDVDMMMEDLQASAEFRAALLETFTERAIADTVDDAR